MLNPVSHAVPEKRRPALRLVKTNDLPREDWLDVRQHGIGSSDAAAAIGLNPYKSALELWVEKTGRGDRLPQVDPHDEESPMYWGNILEPIVAAHYTKRTGNRVRKLNAVLQHPDPDKAWMLANIDREVIGVPEVQILECKTAGINGSRLWKDGVPEYVQLQVMHQLAVTGKQAADVAVLIGGQHLAIHRIERDETMIRQLIELESQFWGYVQRDEAPPADGSDSAELALRCLFPADAGTTLDFSQDSELSATYADLVAIRARIEEDVLRESQFRQRLQQAMGNASLAFFETGRISWKKAKDSQVLDVSALLRDHPDLLADYGITRTGSRRFVVG